MQTNWKTTDDFQDGFLHKRDVTQVSPGALIYGSKNVVITDGDRVGVRKGSELFGASSSAQTPIKSCHTFRKRDGSEIMMRSYGTVLEYYHPTTEAFENLNGGYTSGQIFGYANHNVNDDATDYVYFCNAVEEYSRWNGAYDTLSGTYSGAEATVTINGDVFTDDTFYSGTASAVGGGADTIDIATSDWATDLWNDFYVHILDGAQVGKISKISATTATQITFAAIAGLAGTPQFEIRQLKFDDNNKKLRVGTSDVTYTGYTSSTFTGCSGMPAASDGDAVCQGVEPFPENPRGNVLKVLHTRMYVGNVTKGRQALHYSKVADASDFAFSATRVAGEGGIIDMPEGGGSINGLGIQEDVIYVLKEDIIKTVDFSQGLKADTDDNDMPTVLPLIEAPMVGVSSPLGTFKIDNQLYYISKSGGLKSVSRVASVDFVQSLQLSDSIKNLVDETSFDNAAGIFFKQKAYVAAQVADSPFNDILLVYNFQVKRYSGSQVSYGAWDAPVEGINASCFTIYGGELYYGSSINPEMYRLEVDDRYDDNDLPFEAVARFAFDNAGKPENPKEHSTLFMEGYISESTTITIKERYNYMGGQEERETTLSGSEDDYIVYIPGDNVLGLLPLGVEALADYDGEAAPHDLQKFRVYLQTTHQPWYEISLEVSSNQAGARWEITRFGRDVKLLPEPVTKLRKQLA